MKNFFYILCAIHVIITLFILIQAIAFDQLFDRNVFYLIPIISVLLLATAQFVLEEGRKNIGIIQLFIVTIMLMVLLF